MTRDVSYWHSLEDSELDLLRKNFDAEHYLEKNADLRQLNNDLLEHYICFGEGEGRTPNPYFCPSRYSKEYLDRISPSTSPFLHYLTVGRERGYLALPQKKGDSFDQVLAEQEDLVRQNLDVEFYNSAYPDIARSDVDPVKHYMNNGEAEGRMPTADFDPVYYSRANPDLRDAPFLLFWHYCYAGRAEMRPGIADISAEVDPLRDEALLVRLLRSKISKEYYYANNPDVANLKIDPVIHYIRHGEAEGRLPSWDFDPAVYRASHKDLIEAPFNLYWHFLNSPSDSSTIPSHVSETQATLVADDVAETEPFFDETYYLESCLAARDANVPPLLHYLAVGEKHGMRPRDNFNPNFYRESNPDLVQMPRSLFWHYCAHGIAEMRSPSAYWEFPSEPNLTITAIVPNYNHARFLKERLRSIVDQTYPHIKIIVLDDCSTDNSREVITRIAAECPRPIELHFNKKNAGNVFAQWRKGVELADQDLIWLCESDDFCDPKFAASMVKHFQDMSVTMAFGQIQFCNAQGVFVDGMDKIRQSAEDLDWSSTVKRPAAEWFSKALGTRNVISNVGGCMFRRQELPLEVWEEAQTFRITGDWFLYSRIAGGGQIVYEPSSVAYFRQHGSNTSASNFTRDYYYREYGQLMLAIIEMWDVPQATRKRFLEIVQFEFEHFQMSEQGFEFENLLPVDKILALSPSRKHIQLGFLGFHSGGGEVFPIRLATELIKRGYTVTMMAQNLSEVVEDMRRALPPSIAVYDGSDMALMGRDDYIQRCEIALFHSHVNAIDSSFFSLNKNPLPRPYIITLHGSHDFLDLSAPDVEDYVETLRKNVSVFVYTADKNLELFKRSGLPECPTLKINNAMPIDQASFEMNRADLGIPEDAVVFTFVARGIERKGWRVAVGAFMSLRENNPDTLIHLLLVGDGEKVEVASAMLDESNANDVTFLGYQSRINGIYRISDVAILPTRYPGESNPLCLLQAAQEELPMIATDIGEIANMFTLEEGMGGVLVHPQRSTAGFAHDFYIQMEKMLRSSTRHKFSKYSKRIAQKYDMNKMVDSYIEAYNLAACYHQDMAATNKRHKV